MSKTVDEVTRRLEKGFAVVLLVLILLFLVGLVPLRITSLEKMAAEALTEAGADSVFFDAVRVSLWRGVSIRGLNTEKRIDDSRNYRFSAKRIDISCNLVFAALWHVSGKRPGFSRDFFLDVCERPTEVIRDLTGLIESVRSCRKLTVTGGVVAYFEKGESGISVGDAVVKLEKEKTKRTFRGTFDFSKIHLPGIAQIDYVRGKISIRDDRLLIDNVRGISFDGRIRAEAKVNLVSSKVRNASVVVSGLDLEQFSKGMGFSKGSLKGKTDLEMTFESCPIQFDSLIGKGILTINKLTAFDLPVQNLMMTTLVSPKLKEIHFQKIRSEFRITDGQISSSETVGSGEMMNFKAQGSIQPNGKINQSVDGAFSKKFTEGLSELVKSSLVESEDGGRVFKCKITGTFENPRLDVDRAIYRRAAGSVFGNVKQGFKNIFR